MRRTAVLALSGAVCLAAAGTAAARPAAPAPTPGSLSPPPAWVDTAAGDRWLAYSTSCWTRGCIDYRNPEGRPDLPRIRMRAGETVVFHLSFKPRSLSVVVGGKSYRLRAARAAAWRVRGGGVATLQAFGPRGDAAYVARFQIKSAKEAQGIRLEVDRPSVGPGGTIDLRVVVPLGFEADGVYGLDAELERQDAGGAWVPTHRLLYGFDGAPPSAVPWVPLAAWTVLAVGLTGNEWRTLRIPADAAPGLHRIVKSVGRTSYHVQFTVAA